MLSAPAAAAEPGLPTESVATPPESTALATASDGASNLGNFEAQGAVRLSGGQFVSAVAFGIAIALVGIGGFVLGLTYVFRQPEHVRLEIDPAALDLGEVWAQSGLVCKLPVRNTGIRPVTVLDVQTSGCLCTSVRPRQFVIAPGAQQTLRLTLDLAAGDQRAFIAPKEAFSVRIRLLIDRDKAISPEWVLAGRMRRAFRAYPIPLHFGGASRPVVGRDGPVKHIDLEPLEPLAEVLAESSDVFRVRVARKGDRWGVFVQPRGNMPPGSFRDVLRICVSLASGEVLPPYAVPITGDCQGEIEAVPPSIDFGLIDAGNTARTDILVLSHGAVISSVEAIQGEPDCIFGMVESHSRDLMQIGVALKPARQGTIRGHLRLRLLLGDGKRQELDVPVYAMVAGASPVSATEVFGK